MEREIRGCAPERNWSDQLTVSRGHSVLDGCACCTVTLLRVSRSVMCTEQAEWMTCCEILIQLDLVK